MLMGLQLPNDNSWAHTYHVFSFDAEIYKITSWQNGAIDGLPASPGACRVNSLKLNFIAKEFFEIASNTAKNCEVGGRKFKKLPKPRISQIVDGKDIIEAEFTRVRQR